jgi:phenylpyruvate tautomerase PptA (4-oxalocrotonate tautomerase family)
MPMCDAFIPTEALEPDAEHALVRRVTDLLVEHELRRITDLLDDPAAVKASRDRARAIAWTFVHRTEVYVAGEVPAAPYYKFHVSIPQGQIDDVFREGIVGAVTDAVREIEAGRWPAIEARVWVLTYEVPDGNWGGGGTNVHLRQIVDYVAPGLGEVAEQRWAAAQAEQARTVIALADEQPASA